MRVRVWFLTFRVCLLLFSLSLSVFGCEQGVFIFVFHCWWNASVRDALTGKSRRETVAYMRTKSSKYTGRSSQSMGSSMSSARPSVAAMPARGSAVATTLRSFSVSHGDSEGFSPGDVNEGYMSLAATDVDKLASDTEEHEKEGKEGRNGTHHGRTAAASGVIDDEADGFAQFDLNTVEETIDAAPAQDEDNDDVDVNDDTDDNDSNALLPGFSQNPVEPSQKQTLPGSVDN